MKCVFCGKEINQTTDYWGSSCQPIYEDEKMRCCADCNLSIVIPARIIKVRQQQILEDNRLENEECY